MEQFNLPFDTPKPETTPAEKELSLEYLQTLARTELEDLYFQKVGNHRFMGRTDKEVCEAILNPDGEIDRLRAIDRVDAWEDLGPTGK